MGLVLGLVSDTKVATKKDRRMLRTHGGTMDVRRHRQSSSSRKKPLNHNTRHPTGRRHLPLVDATFVTVFLQILSRTFFANSSPPKYVSDVNQRKTNCVS